jgi:rhodanese-related sulfurtransferase
VLIDDHYDISLALSLPFGYNPGIQLEPWLTSKNKEGAEMLFFKRTNINDAVDECRRTPDAVLLDVREADEFRAGHIAGAVNVPLSSIQTIRIPKDKPLYVYCLRGTRSRQAVGALKRMGYENARSIGGIASYKGQIER